MKITKCKSVIPIYLTGLLWFLYSLMFPLYRLWDYFIVLILSFFLHLSASVISSRLTKKRYQGIDTGDWNVNDVLLTALDNLEKMRQIQSTIQNEEIRKQVQSLEDDSRQIVGFIRNNPQKYSKASRFFQYYLPETVKLLHNYAEMEIQGQKAENRSTGLQNIADFLKQLVTVYHKIRDNIYEDKVLESSIDIEVMETMLRQDGYLNDLAPLSLENGGTDEIFEE
ncbi:MAG: 5-bromo-4-chloroindolyl phosphate hydrolysis family protein [Lacrimispora sphenoides]